MQNYLENDVKDRAALQKCLSVLPGYQTSVQAASGLHDGTISQQQNIFVMNVLSTSIGDAGLKKFMTDCLVPYWVQCTVPECKKWRQLSKDLDLKPSFIDKYVCGMTGAGVKKGNQKDACHNPEDERVEYVKEELWLRQATIPPYLKNSPAAPMLMGYYPDGVGISATDPVMQTKKSKPTVNPCCEFLRPFLHSERRELAGMVRPDMMTESEISAFPLLAQEQPFMYLAIRNLVMAIWALDIKEWVTREQCARQLICRGLNRACCVLFLDPILAYLTSRGLINVGLVAPPTYLHIPSSVQCKVLVIGAGASGLAAAQRLSHFGFKVKVLESKSRIGGRVWDEDHNGVPFAHGATLLAGSVNNPMALIAYQSDQPVHKVTDRCHLVLDSGRLVDPVREKRLEFHFNAMLDAVAQWRELGKPDRSLLGGAADTSVSPGITGISGGCPLHKLSARSWDQNEAMPQFGDPICCCQEVCTVDYSKNKIMVKTDSGESHTADKVIITVPLAVLKSGGITFTPQLPDSKKKAIAMLGVGKVEKVILQFSENFWQGKVKGDDFFGRVPQDASQRGLFNLFYTVPAKKSGARNVHILVTHIVGEALGVICGKSEDEIKDMCLETLCRIFRRKVPNPVSWAVTSWHRDPDIKMAQTFLPVGVDGQALDTMAEAVADKLFFAGEATCRQFPQSVAGAYISGIREASKIIDSFVDDIEPNSSFTEFNNGINNQMVELRNQAYLTTTALNNRHVYIDMAALDNVFITIHLVLAKRLMVTHFDMDLNPTVPVRVLKEELVRQLQIPVSQQQWYHRNNFIPDDASLERAGVMNDSIVEVRPAHQSLQRTSDQPSSRFQAP
ncbi:hypothetical protein C0Q70_07854 [Pomacea canaliculata]|uniref:SWIRM domain-containing protein n=1 Tax=Pomacea canaliculata TaxID=400727 RepID=A0A2T7PGD7_POMCA|nr:hypothetical protein C0Q70_07854 [Pomacea canaliculata]